MTTLAVVLAICFGLKISRQDRDRFVQRPNLQAIVDGEDADPIPSISRTPSAPSGPRSSC